MDLQHAAHDVVQAVVVYDGRLLLLLVAGQEGWNCRRAPRNRPLPPGPPRHAWSTNSPVVSSIRPCHWSARLGTRSGEPDDQRWGSA
jgi:hypothetical protein